MRIASIGILLALGGTAAADQTIMDNNKTVTIDCAKDKNVSLLGNHLAVTLTGACAKVSVTGNHEVVTGQAGTFEVAGNFNAINAVDADALNIMGNNNAVTWKKVAAKADPKVGNVGKANSVTQSK